MYFCTCKSYIMTSFSHWQSNEYAKNQHRQRIKLYISHHYMEHGEHPRGHDTLARRQRNTERRLADIYMGKQLRQPRKKYYYHFTEEEKQQHTICMGRRRRDGHLRWDKDWPQSADRRVHAPHHRLHIARRQGMAVWHLGTQLQTPETLMRHLKNYGTRHTPASHGIHSRHHSTHGGPRTARPKTLRPLSTRVHIIYT